MVDLTNLMVYKAWSEPILKESSELLLVLKSNPIVSDFIQGLIYDIFGDKAKADTYLSRQICLYLHLNKIYELKDDMLGLCLSSKFSLEKPKESNSIMNFLNN